MTSEQTSPTSKAELSEKLQELLLEGHENGLDVKGGYECRNGVKQPDWDVIVTEVEQNEPAE